MSRRRKSPRPPSKRAPVGWEQAESLSVAEAANVLGISRSRAYAWVEDGRLATTQDHLGDHRVKPETLKAFLAARPQQQALPASYGDRWLAGVLADRRVSPEDREAVAAVASWLAEHTDDQGNLDAEATRALDALLAEEATT